MPTTIRDWTIAGVSGGDGALSHAKHGEITFGDRSVNGVAPGRIDLTQMAHGMDDSPEKAVPCFIAAADLLDDSLRDCRKATVHCGHGRSRTGFALVVFLIRHHKFPYDEALSLVVAGMVERGVNFDPSRVNAQLEQGYQDWVKAKDAVIRSMDGKDAVRATYVSVTVKGGKNKVIYELVENKAAPRDDSSGEEDQDVRGRSRSSSDSSDGSPRVNQRRGSLNMETTVREGRTWLRQNNFF